MGAEKVLLPVLIVISSSRLGIDYAEVKSNDDDKQLGKEDDVRGRKNSVKYLK